MNFKKIISVLAMLVALSFAAAASVNGTTGAFYYEVR